MIHDEYFHSPMLEGTLAGMTQHGDALDTDRVNQRHSECSLWLYTSSMPKADDQYALSFKLYVMSKISSWTLCLKSQAVRYV